MKAMDLERLESIAEGLALLFYVLMFVALVMALAGSTGSGFLLLVVGSCAHIGQAGLTEFVDRERGPGDRSRPAQRPKRKPAMEVPRRSQVAAPARAASRGRDRIGLRPGG